MTSKATIAQGQAKWTLVSRKRTPTLKRHAQEANNNSNTQLCHNWGKDGKCPFGQECTYAHGSTELKSRKASNPCWFFNQGQCSKSGDECLFEHVKADMRKPRWLQHPCTSYHCSGYCDHGNRCRGDHEYELTEDEWKYHFPRDRFPGNGYLRQKVTHIQEAFKLDDDEFPSLGGTPAPVPSKCSVWTNVPDAVKDCQRQEPKPEPAAVQELTEDGMLILGSRVEGRVQKIREQIASLQQQVRGLQGGKLGDNQLNDLIGQAISQLVLLG